MYNILKRRGVKIFMDYTITFKEDIDTSAIDKLQDKIEQMHNGEYHKSSRIGKLHKKIEKMHNEGVEQHEQKITKLSKEIWMPKNWANNPQELAKTKK